LLISQYHISALDTKESLSLHGKISALGVWIVAGSTGGGGMRGEEKGITNEELMNEMENIR
jgi:hypothetical protein